MRSKDLISFVGKQAASGAYQETGVQVARFSSVVKSLGRAKLTPGQAFDSQNVTVEDGDLNIRLGFRNVIGAVTGQTTMKGLAWLRTISNSVVMECFITVRNVGGVVKPYELAFDTTNNMWLDHEITQPGAVALNLSDTFWRFTTFRGVVYGWNYNSAESADDPGPLVTYTIGDYDSWVAVKRPTDPTAPIVVNYARNTAGGAAYSSIRWIGLNVATEVTYTSPAQATSSSLSGEAFSIAHAASTLGKGKVKIDLSAITAGNQDLQRSDVLTFTLTLPVDTTIFQIVPSSIKFYAENATGTETELKVTAVPSTNTGGGITRIECYAEFQDKERATWASVKYLSLEYDVSVSSGTAANNLLRFDPVLKGGIVDWYGDNSEAPTAAAISVGYGWYNPTNGYDSGVFGTEIILARSQLIGSKWEFASGLYLGSMPILTTTASAESGVTKTRIYMSRSQRANGTGFGKRRLLAEQDDTDTTYDLTTTATEFEELTEYEPAPLIHDNVLCAAQFKGWMVWGYRDGTIRHSRYNDPLRQASEDDAFSTPIDEDDFNRGNTFTLVDDMPVGFVEIGDTLVILGENGVYVQESTNGRPFGMTPPTKIDCPGCIGYEAFASWKLDNGTPGVVYVSADGGSVWFIAIYQGAGGERGPKPLEVTVKIRSYLQSKLYGGSTLTNPERVQVVIDKETDALILFYTERALILRRPNLETTERDWDVCDFETGHHGSTWVKIAYASGYGLFGGRLNGAIDQFFRANVIDTSTNGQTIVKMDKSAYKPTLTEIGTGFQPSSTDTGADTTTFAVAKQWVNGVTATVNATANGLSTGTTYYLHRWNSTTFSYHTTYLDAINGTNKVNLTGNIVATVTPGDHVMFGDFNDAGTNPGWSTGTPFSPSETGGGLNAATTYYLRFISKSAYSVHATLADSETGANPVNLTATLTSYFVPAGRDDGTAVTGYWESGEWIGPRRRAQEVRVYRQDLGDQPTAQVFIGTGYVPRSADTAADTVLFPKAPGWPTGTPATVSETGGGLTTGIQYFLNQASAMVFSFHLNEADARAGTSKVNLTGQVSATVNPGSAPQTLGVGEKHARFGPRCSSTGLRYRLTMLDGMGPIQGFETKEPILGQAEQR